MDNNYIHFGNFFNDDYRLHNDDAVDCIMMMS